MTVHSRLLQVARLLDKIESITARSNALIAERIYDINQDALNIVDELLVELCEDEDDMQPGVNLVVLDTRRNE